MDQTKAAEIVQAYDALRVKCFDLIKADRTLMGDDVWLWGAIGIGDILIDAHHDGVNCWGLTWTSQTQGNESFDFTIPYNLLD